MFSFFDKVNVYRVITGHIDTFGYRSNSRIRIRDNLLFYGMPILGGVIYGGLQYLDFLKGVPSECWNTAVTITSIFTPLTLTLLTSLYAIKDKLIANKTAVKLLREVIYNICYVILVSLFVLVVSVIIKALQVENTLFCSILFISLFSHLMLTLLMIIKRFVVLFLEAVDCDVLNE